MSMVNICFVANNKENTFFPVVLEHFFNKTSKNGSSPGISFHYMKIFIVHICDDCDY